MSDDEAPQSTDRRAASRMHDDAADAEATGEATPPPSELLAHEREKAETYHRNWQRSAADLANYKRRVEQERAEQARLANAALVINLLPVHDDFGRAVETLDSTLVGLNWVQGVLAIQHKLAALIESMGIEEIPAEGQPFDPTQHEAVGNQPGPDNVCMHVVQKGYALGDKVIRPAMVVVGDGTEATTEGA